MARTTTTTALTPATAPAATAEAEFPLLGYLDGLMEDLRGRVPAALMAWEEEAIHQSRVATRRLKAAVDLMDIVLGKRVRRRFAKVTRNLRRRLGPLRDADVMIEHLRELQSQGRHERAIAWLSERVCREREALRQESAEHGPPAVVLAKLGSWRAVREQIAAARDAVDTLLAESLHLQLDAFAEQADRLIVQTIPAPGGRQDPHELRISGKALRYTLEMAVVQGHKLPGSVVKTFKKMQEGLGFWHDYVVLADRAMRAGLDEQLGHHDPELMDELLELVRAVLRRATHHLDKFNRLWAHDGAALTKAIRAGFPLTRPSPAPPTPLPGQVAAPKSGGESAGSLGGVATGQDASTADAAAVAGEGQGVTDGVTGSRTDPDPAGSGSPATPKGCPPAAASAE